MKFKIASFEGLTSLPTSVAILDSSGTIVAVNDGWKQFGRRNGLHVPHSTIGSSYLQYCQSDEPNLVRFVSELRALLAGERDLLTFIYPCHSTTQALWFCLIGLPLSQNKPPGVALLHVNLTAMLPLPIGSRGARVEDVNSQMPPSANLAAIGGAVECSLQETLSSQLNRILAGPAKEERGAPRSRSGADVQLSKRQREVLHLLGEGKTNKEIATTLFLSPNTVKLHVSAILERLNVRSRTEAALLSSTLFQDRKT